MNHEVFAALGEALKAGEEVALVTIVSANGSTPQRVGAKMLVYADGRVVGTIGGGCYENEALWKAREALKTRKACTVRYELADDFAEESGLICGGQMEVFIEPIEPSPAVYIFGAGHVGQFVGRVAHDAGFRVHVIDDREKFANRERFPDAAEIVVDDIPDWLARTPLPSRPTPSSSRAAIVTIWMRCGRCAPRTCATSVSSAAAPRSSASTTSWRRTAASPIEQLESVHAPIGLDIGAVTPQEIAVSIVAELIAIRRGQEREIASRVAAVDAEGKGGAKLRKVPDVPMVPQVPRVLVPKVRRVRRVRQVRAVQSRLRRSAVIATSAPDGQ